MKYEEDIFSAPGSVEEDSFANIGDYLLFIRRLSMSTDDDLLFDYPDLNVSGDGDDLVAKLLRTHRKWASQVERVIKSTRLSIHCIDRLCVRDLYRGALGERVVKIGLTRRLEPLDRINELGDASVPVRFDVHAIYFSEDAVKLENELHDHFASRRLNWANNRKEFVLASPSEVRSVLVEKVGDGRRSAGNPDRPSRNRPSAIQQETRVDASCPNRA